MTIRFTAEDLELARVQPLLDARHHLLMLVTEATVQEMSRRKVLFSVALIEEKLAASGYTGLFLDVAAYAQARFQMQNDIPLSGCDTISP